MYVYHEYFNAQHVALVYPGDETEPIEGAYMHTSNNGMETTRKCHIFTLSIKNEYISNMYSINYFYGGGGGNRTRVQKPSHMKRLQLILWNGFN